MDLGRRAGGVLCLLSINRLKSKPFDRRTNAGSKWETQPPIRVHHALSCGERLVVDAAWLGLGEVR